MCTAFLERLITKASSQERQAGNWHLINENDVQIKDL